MGSGGIAWTGAGVATTSWARASWTFVMPSDATGIRIGIIPTVVQASGAIVRIANIQLEIGSVATAFTTNTANPQAELAACQRYFYRLGGLSTNNPVGTGFINATAQTAVCVTYPVTMRSAPGFSATGGNNYNVLNGQTNYTSSSITANSLNINNSWIYVSTLGMPSMPVGSASYVFAPSATSYLDFSAEL